MISFSHWMNGTINFRVIQKIVFSGRTSEQANGVNSLLAVPLLGVPISRSANSVLICFWFDAIYSHRTMASNSVWRWFVATRQWMIGWVQVVVVSPFRTVLVTQLSPVHGSSSTRHDQSSSHFSQWRSPNKTGIYLTSIDLLSATCARNVFHMKIFVCEHKVRQLLKTISGQTFFLVRRKRTHENSSFPLSNELKIHFNKNSCWQKLNFFFSFLRSNIRQTQSSIIYHARSAVMGPYVPWWFLTGLWVLKHLIHFWLEMQPRESIKNWCFVWPVRMDSAWRTFPIEFVVP